MTPVFEPITTHRLLIRPVRTEDAHALWERRNDPDVARFQNWTVPFPEARAKATVVGSMELDGPADGEWWMATIADPDDSQVLGDVVVNLTWGSRCAEIGYTLAAEHWGRGFAVESATALVGWLFDNLPLTRVFGMLHPDNAASAQVLERVGMLFEGHTRLSFWVGDDNSDDHIYGMTRPEWETWRDRPRAPATTVELVELDAESAREVRRLRTHKTQERFVAPVLESFADALFPPSIEGDPAIQWLRGVRADGEMVGMVLMTEPTSARPEPYLVRLLVDRMHQRRNLGSRVLELLIDQCRTWGVTGLTVSYVEGRGSPRPFYERHGFVATGERLHGETVARLAID